MTRTKSFVCNVKAEMSVADKVKGKNIDERDRE